MKILILILKIIITPKIEDNHGGIDNNIMG